MNTWTNSNSTRTWSTNATTYSVRFSWNMNTGETKLIPENNQQAANVYLKKNKLW